jgi:hypothetical protein
LIKNYLAGNCDFYLVKHTARYFHQFGMLGEVVLDEVDLVFKSPTSGMACRPKQTAPDQKFMDSMAIFVYEELFLPNLLYQPSGRDILEKAFNAIKGKAPLHLLLAGTSTYEQFINIPTIKYGSFDTRRVVNSKSVKRVLNPYLTRDIVPKTKTLMASDAAVILSALMPQPRILDNHRARAENLRLKCLVDDDLYGKLMERQEKIHSVAAAFWKLNQRLQKNGRTMFSGKSGNAINQLFAARPFDQEYKYVIAFRNPSAKQKFVYPFQNICCRRSIGNYRWYTEIIYTFSYRCWFRKDHKLFSCDCGHCENICCYIWDQYCYYI